MLILSRIVEAVQRRLDVLQVLLDKPNTPIGGEDADAAIDIMALQDALNNATEIITYMVGSMPPETAARCPFTRLRRFAAQIRELNRPLAAEGLPRRLMEYAGEVEACEGIRAERARNAVVRPATAEDWAANAAGFEREFGKSPAAFMAGAGAVPSPVPGARDAVASANTAEFERAAPGWPMVPPPKT